MENSRLKDLENYLAEISSLPEFVGVNSMCPNVKGPFGNTPIHIAAIRGDLDAIGLLIEAGVDVNAQGEHGYTPLHEAVEQGQHEAARLLLANGCNVKMVNEDGLSPLDLARQLDDQNMIEIIEKTAETRH